MTLTECLLCGGRLEACEKEAAVNQQIDIAPKPFIATEYHLFESENTLFPS